MNQRRDSDEITEPASSFIVAEYAPVWFTVVAESVVDATACRKRKYFTTCADGKRHRSAKEAGPMSHGECIARAGCK